MRDGSPNLVARPADRNPAGGDGSLLRALLDGPMADGRVLWIGVRPARRAPMRAVDAATLDAASGMAGDRYAGRSGTRQISLIGEEDLQAIGSFLHRPPPHPALLRRNLVVRGINLLALKDRMFRLGDAVLAVTGACHPCSRMVETLGPEGYNAVRGHGGILARVVRGGTVRIGDAITRLPGPEPLSSQPPLW